jgi:hypothetical protein
MKILRAGEAAFEAKWQQLLDDDYLGYPLLSTLDVQYSKEYSGRSQWEDMSFIVVEGVAPLMGLRIARRIQPDGSAQLSGFGRPIAYLESSKMDSMQQKGAARILCGELEAILQAEKNTSVTYRQLRPSLSPVGEFLLRAGAKATPCLTQIIHLSLSEAELWQQIRGRYKSLINWGKRSLKLCVGDHSTITLKDIERFRQLHIDVAGRETRTRRTWEIQLEMIQQRQGFAILGFLDAELVTAVLFVHSRQYCYYGVAASRRDMFDKPLGHFLIWTGILQAKNFGCRYLELGEQVFPGQGTGTPSPKERGISTFKSGFGGATYIRLTISLINSALPESQAMKVKGE